jgi:hypothetical protein
MPSYLVTFKFGRNADFARRLDDFIGCVTVGDWWAETGTTIIVHSDEPIDAFSRRITAPSVFDEDNDIVVVVDLDNREGRACGPFSDGALFTAAPWVVRI